MGDSLYHEEGGGLEPRDPTLEDLAKICHELNARGAKYVVVGGFAIILHGYPRHTGDIDLLVSTSPENEKLVIDSVATLPDGAAREVRPGEIAENTVVRVMDEVLVDLMHSGCGITYESAIGDAVMKEVYGVRFPVASQRTLWKMKQTLREKDIPDKIFLRQWAEDTGIELDPSPSSAATSLPQSGWLDRLAFKIETWLTNRRMRKP